VINFFQKDSENKRRFTSKFLLIPEVIRGNISIVGRPLWDTDDNALHLGKKGITGLVQINYYKRLSTKEIEYYNYYYAKNQSIMLDIEIILRTISLIIFGKIY
jgi:lipopolysaccharide/colanic/teichoic acid biosynthesis glycosyltransferase